MPFIRLGILNGVEYAGYSLLGIGGVEIWILHGGGWTMGRSILEDARMGPDHDGYEGVRFEVKGGFEDELRCSEFKRI